MCFIWLPKLKGSRLSIRGWHHSLQSCVLMLTRSTYKDMHTNILCSLLEDLCSLTTPIHWYTSWFFHCWTILRKLVGTRGLVSILHGCIVNYVKLVMHQLWKYQTTNTPTSMDIWSILHYHTTSWIKDSRSFNWKSTLF